MKNIIIVVIYVLLVVSFQPNSIIDTKPNINTAQVHIYTETVYEYAEKITGAPARILQAIAIVESGEDDLAIGDNGVSKGRMQLNEKYRAERISKYGNYNPFDPKDAVVIAGYIYMDNFKRLGSHRLAIAAYRQGVVGVLRHGATNWYVERVQKQIERLSNENI